MSTKRLLIVIPLVLLAFLLQSYFWVPSYEKQTVGNPKRLTEYITSSIGDASLLNPILNADSASSQIAGHVFEGLLDYDENLQYRGRLATHWDIFEEAYFQVHEDAFAEGLEDARPEALIERIRNAYPDIGNIRSVEVVRETPEDVRLPVPGKKAGEEGAEIEVRIDPPPRIKFTLNKVDQDFFEKLKPILGEGYFDAFDPVKYCEFPEGVPEETRVRMAGDLLPSFEHNPVILFYLRKGVRFHDGEPFTAKDVKFTYESIVNPRNLSPRVPDFEPVKEITVPDDHTVRIVYKRLYSPAIGTWGIGMLPEHLLNREALERQALQKGKDPAAFTMRNSDFNRNPVGCGPFVFKEWKSDQYITLNRYEDYWEGAPNYTLYTYRVIPDLLTQEMEFYAGTVDSYGVEPHQVARLSKDPRFQSFSALSFGYSFIGYNLRKAPFDDVRIRKALGMAIDTEKIIKYVLYNQGERITGPFPKQTDFYNHDAPILPYDPEGALKLLSEAGWERDGQGRLLKDGKQMRFSIITNNGNETRKAISIIAQDAWKQLGIDVRADYLEWAVFINERVDKGDFDALVLGWSMGIDPDLYQIWHSSQTGHYQLNFVGFKNKEADDLIIRIRKEYDHDRQVALCRRLHEIIAEEQPYTFLFAPKATGVMDKRIVIKEVDPDGKVVYKKITPTKSGSYTFHFNRWVKLPTAPEFTPEG